MATEALNFFQRREINNFLENYLPDYLSNGGYFTDSSGLGVISVDGIVDMQSVIPSAISTRPQKVRCGSYYRNSVYGVSRGGGIFEWKDDEPKANHNGVTKISNTVPWTGLQATLPDFLACEGETEPGGTGCWIRQYVILDLHMSGAVPNDDTVDNKAAIDAAINVVKANHAPLHAPTGSWRIATQLADIDRPIRIMGDGCSPYLTAPGIRDNGTWFFIDHSGKGFPLIGATQITGSTLMGFGTYRTQPTPGPGWTPTDHDYDIYANTTEVNLRNIVLHNPTKGVYLYKAGRSLIENLQGQAMQTLLRIDKTLDVVRINNLHNWPFWKNQADVNAYTKANCDTIYLERVDNPNITSVFSFSARSMIRFGQSADGKASQVAAINLNQDVASNSESAIWVDSTVADGITGTFTNVRGGVAIKIDGNNSRLAFTNYNCNTAPNAAVTVGGTGNILTFTGDVVATGYNTSSGGYSAFDVASGNTLRINGIPKTSTTSRYSGAGDVYVDEWITYSPTVTSSTGTITTVGAVVARYKRWNDSCSVMLQITITTNGTGAGKLNVTLPVTVKGQPGVGFGRLTNGSGHQLQAHLTVDTTSMDVTKYDGTYPIVDGSVVTVFATYRTTTANT